MNKELKRLYIYMLKYKWIPGDQESYWGDRRRLSYYYYIDLKSHNNKGRTCFCLRANGS